MNTLISLHKFPSWSHLLLLSNEPHKWNALLIAFADVDVHVCFGPPDLLDNVCLSHSLPIFCSAHSPAATLNACTRPDCLTICVLSGVSSKGSDELLHRAASLFSVTVAPFSKARFAQSFLRSQLRFALTSPCSLRCVHL